VSDHGCSPVQLGDRAQIDRECQYDLLAFAQAQIGGLDKYPVALRLTALHSFLRPPGMVM